MADLNIRRDGTVSAGQLEEILTALCDEIAETLENVGAAFDVLEDRLSRLEGPLSTIYADARKDAKQRKRRKG